MAMSCVSFRFPGAASAGMLLGITGLLSQQRRGASEEVELDVGPAVVVVLALI